VFETRAFIEIADRQLDHGVASVIGVESNRVTNAIGTEGEAAEGREERGSEVVGAGATNNETVMIAIGHFTDPDCTVACLLDSRPIVIAKQ
jgi:hypothetical protein